MVDVAELLGALAEHLDRQPEAILGIGVKDGEYRVSYEWGREAADSPMVAAASYGLDNTLEGALTQVAEEVGVK